MARLSANGHEIYRLSREFTPKKDDTLTTWERKTYSIRSNNTILEKLDVKFKSDHFNPNGYMHSYGWKKRVNAGKNTKTAEYWRDHLIAKGYTVEL